MTIKQYKQVLDLFEALPNFQSYAYYGEDIKDVHFNEDGQITDVFFQVGRLKRLTCDIELDSGRCKIETDIGGVYCLYANASDSHIVTVFVMEG
tara:strand:+ start:326 stop:607 length:282 start_codon:yes stop_codon:yes gene_type:complete